MTGTSRTGRAVVAVLQHDFHSSPQESHAGPNRPLRQSDFTDLQFVQGGGG